MIHLRWDYVCELKRCNPDTTVKIDVYGEEDPETPTRMFRRIYVCLSVLKRGFREGGREFLGLDGAFMRGQYPRQMLTTVGVDANNGIYPVAYGHNKRSYSSVSSQRNESVPKKTTGTKRTSTVTETSIAAAEVRTQASQAGTQASTGSTFKRTKKITSRITPEKVNFMLV
nr:putative transposase, mutator type, MULE transposase domain protein [Tanacetum cinerariifolium]